MGTIRTFILLIAIAEVAAAQSPDNVLLVLNESSPQSLEIGQYYAQKRGLPAQNVLRIKTVLTEEISRDDFSRQLEVPIATWLMRNSAQDRILYFVLTKGIPLRVAGLSGEKGTVASVDSELTLLYARMLGAQAPLPGRIGNPYFLSDAIIARARQFSHQNMQIYLVSRLDGYTVADIRGLIDRGSAPSREGKILLDQKGPASEKGDDWLQAAAEWLKANGFADRTVLDTGSNVLKDQTGVLGYYSWGSNDPAITVRSLGLGFVPGALAAMFVSSDGRTFAEPPPGWNLGTWKDPSSHFGGSPQSLTGDLIREGVTGTAGHVAEPYLEYTIRPNILFPAYLSGFNLIESFYLAMPALSWQTVVIGDPLCAPFRTKSLTPGEIDKGIDPGTELPGYFSDHRMRVVGMTLAKTGTVNPEITKLLIRAEVRLAKKDIAGAQKDLEDATAQDNRLASAHFLLASIYDQNKEYDKADDRYRRTLEVTPDHVMALNNLAYSLAVRKKSPNEALPLAEKAYKLSNGNASIGDTLGWIHHLLGDNKKANEYLEQAARGAFQNPEILLHWAVVCADLGESLQAITVLDRALKLNPSLAESDEVKQLKTSLKIKNP